jgi:hypothetical protein
MPPLVLESTQRLSAYSAGKQTLIFTWAVKHLHVFGHIRVIWSAWWVSSSGDQCFPNFLTHVPVTWEKAFTLTTGYGIYIYKKTCCLRFCNLTFLAIEINCITI